MNLWLFEIITYKWCRHQDLNSGPTDYKTSVLPLPCVSYHFRSGKYFGFDRVVAIGNLSPGAIAIDHFTARPKGATQMPQCGVTALEKDMLAEPHR